MEELSDEMARVAIHEAGHVIVGHALGIEPAGIITITPFHEGTGISFGAHSSPVYGTAEDWIEIGVRTLHAGSLALFIAGEQDWRRGRSMDLKRIRQLLDDGNYESEETKREHSAWLQEDAAW